MSKLVPLTLKIWFLDFSLHIGERQKRIKIALDEQNINDN